MSRSAVFEQPGRRIALISLVAACLVQQALAQSDILVLRRWECVGKLRACKCEPRSGLQVLVWLLNERPARLAGIGHPQAASAGPVPPTREQLLAIGPLPYFGDVAGGWQAHLHQAAAAA